MDSGFGDKFREAIGIPAANAELVNGILIPKAGSPAPAFFTGTVIQAFKRYGTECHGIDCEDPRQICVSLLDRNFPKLLSMWQKAKGNQPAAKARPMYVIPQMENGTFNPDEYTWEAKRLMTLYWLADALTNPDGIYPNSAAIVEGEEVYVKRYLDPTRKFGSEEVKLVFVEIDHNNLHVVITSFLEKPQRLAKYCGLPALYTNPNLRP